MEYYLLPGFEERSVIPAAIGGAIVKLASMGQLPTGCEGDSSVGTFSDYLPTAPCAKSDGPSRTNLDKDWRELVAEELDKRRGEEQRRAAKEDRGKK